MINKQNLWFITLFSLIIVLSVYYLTMSKDELETISTMSDATTTSVVSIENETLVAARVANEEALIAKLEELQGILLNSEATIEEKNQAYEELKNINEEESIKEQIENIIKENYNLEAVVTISEDNINIIVSSKEHDSTLANNIIRSVQSLFSNSMYITVKFS